MDPEEIWTSSSSAQRIRELVNVEKVSSFVFRDGALHGIDAYIQDIARVLQHAASSLQLLRVAQAGTEDDTGAEPLPGGEERSELFVQEATAYFQTLDASHSSWLSLMGCVLCSF